MNGKGLTTDLSCFLTLLIAVSCAAGQTLTNEQRLERCRTNTEYIASYQNEGRIVDAFLRSSFDESARHDYGKLNDAIPNNRILTPYRDVRTQQMVANFYALKWNPVWASDKVAFQKALRTQIVSLINSKRGTPVNEWIARRDEIDRQIRFHEDRQKELKCDEQFVKPDAEPSKVDLSGQWSDEWGYKIVLKDSGGSITGTFTSGGNVGVFTSGSYDNQTRKVTLEYEEPWKKSRGKVVLILSADGRRMRGNYVSIVPGYSAPQEGVWTMSR